MQLSRLLPAMFQGGVIGPCPDNDAACATLACPGCTAGGDCLDGRCVCKLAYEGPNCSQHIVTGQLLTSRYPTLGGAYGAWQPPQAGAPGVPDLTIILIASTVGGVVLVMTAAFIVLLLRGHKKRDFEAAVQDALS